MELILLITVAPLTLCAQSMHRVAGVVLDEADKPLAHARVKLMGKGSTARQILSATMIAVPSFGAPEYTIGPGPEPEVARVESREDGTFEFMAVEPGDWRLSAETGADVGTPMGGVVPASVADRDLEGVRIHLTALFPVDITVDWGNAQPGATVGDGWSPVTFTPVDGQPQVFSPLLKGFPGRYRVTPSGTWGDLYVAAVMWGTRDVNGQVVELTPTAGPFKVIYKSGTGEVRGTVRQGEASSVMLISHEAGDVSVIRTTKCRSGGAFEIGDVPPGDYSVVAFDHSDDGGVQWDQLPSTIAQIASSVRVEAGATTWGVELRMNKWPW
jgi:hypothetical protein